MVKPFIKSLMNRRDFIGTTAAAGAGLLLTGCNQDDSPAPAAKKSNLSAINVALIGCGAEGMVLSESLMNIMNTGDIKVVAVCDIWDYARKKAKNTYKDSGFAVNDYSDYEDLLAKEKDLQAVIVAVPDFWHAPITNACLKAGLHVYCEKMMSNTLDGARSMVKTMRETGKLLQIGHQRRSNPRYLFAKSRLLNEVKCCGKITAAHAQWNRAVADDLGWPKHSDIPADKLAKYGFKDMHQFRNWRWFRGLGGGMLSDLGAHQIDIFNWWLGSKARSVIASGGLDYYSNHDWYDNAMVIYEFPLKNADGSEYVARAFYQVQTTTSAGGGYFEMFMGDDGTIKMSEDPNICAIWREPRSLNPTWDDIVAHNYVHLKEKAGDDAAKVDVRETAALAQYDIPVFFSKPPHQPHLENFFAAVRGSAKLNCPADEAFRSEYIIHKANEAIAAQTRLVITPEEVEA